jgi:phenylacetyl-CoA:acceptor oxidoreductase
MSSNNAVRAAQAGKRIPTYCYQCINGPDLLTVKVVDGVATEVEPNFAVRGMHPADGRGS